MIYSLITPKAVQKQLDALPDEVYDRVAAKIQLLAETPRPDGVVKLKGSDNEYRLRIGNYRLRYEIDDQELIILLLQCKHRKDVYREQVFRIEPCRSLRVRDKAQLLPECFLALLARFLRLTHTQATVDTKLSNLPFRHQALK
jgi:mRNA interferase RelE/StbE